MAAPTRIDLWPRGSGTNVGICHPKLVFGTNGTIRVLNFTAGSDGDAFGRCRIPDDIAASPNPHIILLFMVPATSGTCRLNVGTALIDVGDAVDSAITMETAQDISVPGTSRLLQEVRFPSAGNITTDLSGAGGQLLKVQVTHVGSVDGLAADTELLGAWLMTDLS